MLKSQTNALSVFSYEGNEITFQNENGVMVNATQMAKSFNKRPTDWLRLPSTQEFIDTLSEVRKSHITYVETVRGFYADGRPQGTWMHEDVALEFARWLSPSFAIWCNDRIKELLTQGVTTVTNDDEVIAQAMNVLQRRLEESRQRQRVFEVKVEQQDEQIKTLTPKAEYTDKVLQSKNVYRVTQIAKELGMSGEALNRKLREKGIQYNQSGQWLLYSKYQNRGYTQTITTTYEKRLSDGTVTTGTSILTVWTERGRAFIHHLFGHRAFERNTLTVTEGGAL